MAGNAFTKKYLTELLDDRIKAIEEGSASTGYTQNEILLMRMRRENAIADAREVASRMPLMVELIELLDEMDDSVLANVDRSVTDKINQLISLDSRITSNVRGDHRPYNYTTVNNVEQLILKERKERGGTNPAQQLERLRRVRDYVTQAQADEFSLTLMRSLGFLDIIKTAING